jgi:DNA primase
VGNSRVDEWEANYETYTEAQVESVIAECGIEVESETTTHFLCYCPFHNNTDSPAFAVDKEIGKYICFNPSCYSSGELEELPRKLLKMNVFQSKRLILQYREGRNKSLKDKRLEREKNKELPKFDQKIIDRMAEQFRGSVAEDYMRGRGFDEDTLRQFQVGYSAVKNLVAVPMYSLENEPVGIVGRRLPPIDFKYRFYNSKNLPKRLIPWNINNARKHGETLILCEAAFDAMAIHQAGYPNVVALLGGYITPWHHEIIDRNFSKLIIMTDFDEKKYTVNCKPCKSNGFKICNGHRAGRDFGRTIVKQFPNKTVRWAALDDKNVYPEGCKDASNILEKYGTNEIAQCLKNSVSNFEYNRWNIE